MKLTCIFNLTSFMFFLFIATSSNAQSVAHFEEVSQNIYTDGTNIGRLHHFEHVFINDAELHKQFLRFDKSRWTQKKINYISLVAVGAGVVGWLVIQEKTDFARFPKPALGAIFAGFILAPATMIVANAIIIPIKIKRKNDLLRSYEAKQGKAIGQSLRLGVSNHGIGLSLTF